MIYLICINEVSKFQLILFNDFFKRLILKNYNSNLKFLKKSKDYNFKIW